MAGGFALSICLLYLKLYASGCPISAGCSNVVFSRYGAFMGIPVSAFSLAFWGGIPLLGSSTVVWRQRAFIGAKWAAVAAAVGFLVIQFYVLRAFCVYCTLHSLCVFGFAILAKNPTGRLLPLGVLVGGALIMHTAAVTAKAPGATVGLNPQEILKQTWAQKTMLPWYLPVKDGEFEQQDAAELAVVSLTCSHCATYLERVHGGSEPPPFVIFYADSERAGRLTQAMLSAVWPLRDPVEKRRVFYALMERYLSDRERFMASPESWEEAVAELKPPLSVADAELKPAVADAKIILGEHLKLIKQLGVGVLPARFPVRSPDAGPK